MVFVSFRAGMCHLRLTELVYLLQEFCSQSGSSDVCPSQIEEFSSSGEDDELEDFDSVAASVANGECEGSDKRSILETKMVDEYLKAMADKIPALACIF